MRSRRSRTAVAGAHRRPAARSDPWSPRARPHAWLDIAHHEPSPPLCHRGNSEPNPRQHHTGNLCPDRGHRDDPVTRKLGGPRTGNGAHDQHQRPGTLRRPSNRTPQSTSGPAARSDRCTPGRRLGAGQPGGSAQPLEQSRLDVHRPTPTDGRVDRGVRGARPARLRHARHRANRTTTPWPVSGGHGSAGSLHHSVPFVAWSACAAGWLRSVASPPPSYAASRSCHPAPKTGRPTSAARQK